ncbi:MAG: hypothetical protein KIT87_17015 [Anaerolineae bacterium]|nr:hypothetical protein [Anaerolineae bacterium]
MFAVVKSTASQVYKPISLLLTILPALLLVIIITRAVYVQTGRASGPMPQHRAVVTVPPSVEDMIAMPAHTVPVITVPPSVEDMIAIPAHAVHEQQDYRFFYR